MNERDFLELFEEIDKYGYRILPLCEDGFCMLYRPSIQEYLINYKKDYEDYDGYITETSDGELTINFEIALKIYELDSSLEVY